MMTIMSKDSSIYMYLSLPSQCVILINKLVQEQSSPEAKQEGVPDRQRAYLCDFAGLDGLKDICIA